MRVPHTFRRVVLVVLALVALPFSAVASKPEPVVKGTWRGAPPSAPLQTDVSLTLHLLAGDNAQVTAEIVPSAGIQVVGGSLPWNGVLARNGTIDLPVTVRVLADGEWTLGARITIYRPEGNQIASAVLEISASNSTAVFGRRPLALDEMSPDALRELGIAQEIAGPAVPGLGAPAVATTVSGTILWRDPEGHAHPVRRAFVALTEGGVLRTTTSTNDAGAYTAAVNVASIKVTVYSRDFDNIRVIVFPVGQPTQRYVLESAETPVTGAATTIDITSGVTTRGTQGAPANDSLSARAFAVYDAMLTYWFQATAIIGTNHQQALVHFPESTAAGAVCATSCYVGGNTQQLYILHDDAFDWDVLGHEFFHFTTHRAGLRTLTTSLGGFHNFGTAIGQNDGKGHIRDRDEGMRLAWGEGVATVMSLMIQNSPPSPFAFPSLLNVRDRTYHDTEDASLEFDAETPVPSHGFGSENSVMGVIWDLFDTNQDADGTVTDTFAGANATLFWNAINVFLPCNPCDRVDRFWVALEQLFGPTSPTTFSLGKLFAMNKIASKTLEPADGASVPGTVGPTFRWQPNGDPSAAHQNNEALIAFSRDNFQRHVVVLPVPTNATEFKPDDAQWQQVQAGGTGGQPYKWFVATGRSDAPFVPAGWYWYSDVGTVVPRSIEATITWGPVGADVDLHLANPGGEDIAYYNTTTSWGFLDRDCITTCAQEIISVLTLPFPGSYNLFAHYFDDHDRGAATVHAVVRSGSQVLLDQTFVLGTTGAQRSIISFALDTVQTSPAMDSGGVTTLDPARLPPKRR